MKHRAKTYSKFINEAYIDPEGRLQDLEFTQDDLYASEMIDHINQIREFLEDSGAKRVSLFGRPDEHPVVFKFEYKSNHYFMELDLDDDTVTIHAKSPNTGSPYKIYNDSAESFFDLAMNTGLDFLLL